MKALWFEPKEHDQAFPEACGATGAKSVRCAHSYFLTQISSSVMASQIRIGSLKVPL